jgi:small-conductance mechanosensitive channel
LAARPVVSARERIAVDVQEEHQPELVKAAVKVKRRARPWRAIIALALAIISAGVSVAFGHGMKSLFEPGHLGASIGAASAAVAFFFFATVAVLAFARRTRQALRSVTGSTHAEMARYAIVLVGAILAITITLVLLKVPVEQLLVGGALATIIVTIAGQQSLSNIFAGIVLLLSRPFGVGDKIRLRSGALGGQHEGIVTEIGITYLQLSTADGLISLPNSQVLASAVNRRPSPAEPGGPEDHVAGPPSPPSAEGAAGPGTGRAPGMRAGSVA